MIFSYGNGEYLEGNIHVKGQIILGEHRLYLKGAQGDLTQTYIPLEKIERIKIKSRGARLRAPAMEIEVHVRPSLIVKYVVLLTGEKTHLSNLVKDIVKCRGFKKKFLKKEWFDDESG